MNKWVLLIGSMVMFVVGRLVNNSSDMSVAIGLAWIAAALFVGERKKKRRQSHERLPR